MIKEFCQCIWRHQEDSYLHNTQNDLQHILRHKHIHTHKTLFHLLDVLYNF